MIYNVYFILYEIKIPWNTENTQNLDFWLARREKQMDDTDWVCGDSSLGFFMFRSGISQVPKVSSWSEVGLKPQTLEHWRTCVG